MSQVKWIPYIPKTQRPPFGRLVDTKIHDEHGERNVQKLRLDSSGMWFGPDGTYVYYTPTHFGWTP